MLDRSEPKKQNSLFGRPAEEQKPAVEEVSDGDDTYEALARASKRESLIGRMNQAFQDVLQTNRGQGKMRAPAEEAGDDPNVTADDLAIRRARNIKLHRMVVPEGVIIEGSLSGGSESEIAGKVDGDVTVDGQLYLAASALVSGNVRATSCRVDGLVEGRVECSEDLELGKTGRLNADCVGGKEVNVAGQVFGNVTTGGIVRLYSSAKLTGNIRARRLVIEDGAHFNGQCTMRAPAQRGDAKPQ
ncbi:MAG: polymer-forming cytoskeletal protein [Candidatus Hydrogenedentes bacterium]|nr:polymer-forming cytoskeletal protein [Candidatus Hydrogenedentota bacterium]